MKKLIKSIGLMAFAGLSLVSCSSDDDGFSFSEDQITGQWAYSKQRYAINGVWSEEMDYEGNESATCPDFWQLNADHTTLERDYWSSECDYYDDTATWSKSGNTITIADGDLSGSYNVISLSSTSLVIEETYSEEGFTYIDQYTFVKAN
ncbi:lipocalin family protein [Flavobacterium silvaticum]|uniref:Lipocalin-like domain-containing protein n=1 Tax=Flavobacterium silvaticum TaxID=1852020 RepID=A0A972FVC0_9FLAO|nr:lipocalin family protein [Flavobacterium silvaticum]NMH29348.1 hypothetical protein [Flavobacterium silvaticum]